MNEVVNNGFALSNFNAVDMLLAEREKIKSEILSLSEISEKFSSAFKHFETSQSYRLYNDSDKHQYYERCEIYHSLKNPKGAILALDTYMWWNVFNMSHLEMILPAEKRNEWKEHLSNFDVPEFTMENIVSAFGDYFHNSSRYFAEKVDGVFKRLSKTHVTNNPAGFRSRMIYENAAYFTTWGTYSVSGYFSEYLQDFIEIVAVLNGFPMPDSRLAHNLIYDAYKIGTGEWIDCYGNTFRLRVYKKGTLHLEINPELALKLNNILASLYPLAIANQIRDSFKSKKPQKEWRPIIKPIPSAVLDVLKFGLKVKRENESYKVFLNDTVDKHIQGEVNYILEQIGMVDDIFDYDPTETISYVVQNGVIPDQKSFQYYPTPDIISMEAAECLNVFLGQSILEPSAGTGELLKYLEPFKESITAIEIDQNRCKVLENKGYNVIQDDFMKISRLSFDRIIMNPPYSEGRWKAHVIKAASFLNTGGRLVAVLPKSAIGAFNDLKGYSVQYGKVFENEFRYTSIDVVIVIIERN